MNEKGWKNEFKIRKGVRYIICAHESEEWLWQYMNRKLGTSYYYVEYLTW